MSVKLMHVKTQKCSISSSIKIYERIKEVYVKLGSFQKGGP